MNDDLKFILCVLLLIACGIGLIEFIQYNRCDNYQQLTGNNSKYKFFDSCYVMHQDRFYRYDEYKALVKQINFDSKEK